jgi:hypothetical protein
MAKACTCRVPLPSVKEKEGKKGTVGPTSQKICCLSCFSLLLFFKKKKFLELNYKFDIEIYSEGIRELIDRTISERYNSLQSGAIP